MSKLRFIGAGTRQLTVGGTPGKAVKDFWLTGDQVNKIWKVSRPDGRYTFDQRRSYRVTVNTKDEGWLEIRSDLVFWAASWHEMPRVVKERALKINEFMESL